MEARFSYLPGSPEDAAFLLSFLEGRKKENNIKRREMKQ